MSYQRVIPRDLFNEANLMKCYGQLYLELEHMNVPGVELEHHGDNFIITQDESSGDLTINNILLVVGRKTYGFYRPLNSREGWPLYLMTGDDPIPVFLPGTGVGYLSDEFKRFILKGTEWEHP